MPVSRLHYKATALKEFFCLFVLIPPDTNTMPGEVFQTWNHFQKAVPVHFSLANELDNVSPISEVVDGKVSIFSTASLWLWLISCHVMETNSCVLPIAKFLDQL